MLCAAELRAQRQCLASDGALCRKERGYGAFRDVSCYVAQGDPQSGQGNGVKRGLFRIDFLRLPIIFRLANLNIFPHWTQTINIHINIKTSFIFASNGIAAAVYVTATSTQPAARTLTTTTWHRPLLLLLLLSSAKL